MDRMWTQAGRDLLALQVQPARLQGGEVLGDENRRDSISGRIRLAKQGPGRAGRGTSLAHFPSASA